MTTNLPAKHYPDFSHYIKELKKAQEETLHNTLEVQFFYNEVVEYLKTIDLELDHTISVFDGGINLRIVATSTNSFHGFQAFWNNLVRKIAGPDYEPMGFRLVPTYPYMETYYQDPIQPNRYLNLSISLPLEGLVDLKITKTLIPTTTSHYTYTIL